MLDAILSIEDKAEALKKEFQKQHADLDAELVDKKAKLEKSFADQFAKYQEQVETQYVGRITSFKQMADQEAETDKDKIRRAFETQKSELVKAAVEKVVNKYGHS